MLATKTMTKTKFHSYSQTQLKMLCDNICDSLEELLDYFEIDYKNVNPKMVSMKCPIHDGDNASALNIYHQGDNYRGNWKCRTHGCDKIFKGSIIGFIRGVLSNRKYDWTEEGDNTCSFQEAIDFATKFIGKSLGDYKVSKSEQEKNSFTQIVQKITEKTEKQKPQITRQLVRDILEIPSVYYLERGYSKEILEKYDIGLCSRPNKEMTGRVVAPIYDDEHEYVIGCTGRSIFEKCSQCKSHHDPVESCPSDYDNWKHSKWKHSSGFKSQNHLYNIWFAKKYIQESNVAIIVESPGNVWRLEENGIHNSVAIFGSSMSDRQKIILDSTGAMKLVVLTDNDDAGRKAAELIKQKCCKTYQVYVPNISKNDIGDMNSEEITNEIKSFIGKIQ